MRTNTSEFFHHLKIIRSYQRKPTIPKPLRLQCLMFLRMQSLHPSIAFVLPLSFISSWWKCLYHLFRYRASLTLDIWNEDTSHTTPNDTLELFQIKVFGFNDLGGFNTTCTAFPSSCIHNFKVVSTDCYNWQILSIVSVYIFNSCHSLWNQSWILPPKKTHIFL